MKPKPTNLRRLQGNAGHRPLNEREPQPPAVEALRAPSYFSPDARRLYRALGGALRAVGLLTVLDLPKFEILVIHLAAHRRLYVTLQRAIAMPEGSGPVPDTWRLERQLRQTAETVKGLCGGFGLDPSERSRIQVQAPLVGRGVNPLDKFIYRDRGESTVERLQREGLALRRKTPAVDLEDDDDEDDDGSA